MPRWGIEYRSSELQHKAVTTRLCAPIFTTTLYERKMKENNLCLILCLHFLLLAVILIRAAYGSNLLHICIKYRDYLLKQERFTSSGGTINWWYKKNYKYRLT